MQACGVVRVILRYPIAISTARRYLRFDLQDTAVPFSFASSLFGSSHHGRENLPLRLCYGPLVMALEDEGTKVGGVGDEEKTAKTTNDTEISTSSSIVDEERPHITFKTKMAIFVCFHPTSNSTGYLTSP